MRKNPRYSYLSEKSVARIAEKRELRLKESKQSAAQSAKKTVPTPVVKPMSPDRGIIYIIGSVDGQTPYKIGFSRNADVRKRLCSIQSATWIELKVYYKSNLISNASQIERRIHGRYADKRIRREWFSLTEQDIQKIQHEIETDDYSDEKLFNTLLVKYGEYKTMGLL